MPDSAKPRPDARASATHERAATRSRLVGVHALLLMFAVLVVWAAVGRDPRGVASASAFDVAASTPEPADVEANPIPAVTTKSATPIHRPHLAAAPLPRTPPTASFTRPAPVESDSSDSPTVTAPETERPREIKAAPVAATGPSAETDSMIALPRPGEAWPPAMPTDPSDAPFYHVGGLYGTPGAARIVYLIDASGSLIDTLPFIQKQLQQTLGELRPEQSFAVVFFAGNRVLEAPPVGMKSATHRAVQITSQWIDPASGRVIASGRPHPDAAIRRAMAYQPDAVILLSDGLTGAGDGAMAERAQLLSLIDTANTSGVVFHTLQVSRPDPLAGPTQRGTLEMIALQSGGVHRYIGEDDLLPR